MHVAFLINIRLNNTFEFGKFIFLHFQFFHQTRRRWFFTGTIVIDVIIIIIDVSKRKALYTKTFVQISILFGQWYLYKFNTRGEFSGQPMVATFDGLAGFAPSYNLR